MQLSQTQLANMRQLIAQNPAMAQALIQQIEATNPALLQQLGANPQDAIREILQAGELGDEDDGDGILHNIPPGSHVVNVTAEERAAIERVSLLY